MAKKKEPDAERQHALLSPSGAARWIACPPSARLEEQFSDTGSSSAKEGTLAHSIAELKLRKQFVEPMGPRKFNSAMKKLEADPLYDREMQRHTDCYVDYIQNIVHGFDFKPHIAVEKWVDLKDFIPGCSGTSDCIIIGGNILHVVDFKYGKRVKVSAEENPQMMLYALGAYLSYRVLFPIEQVTMSIVQPRMDNISDWTIPIGRLLSWGENIKPIAQQASAGGGEFHPDDDTCQFCRAKGECRARTSSLFEMEPELEKAPALLNNEEISRLLPLAKAAAAFAKDLEAQALSKCLAGEEIPGWKAVAGRAVRQWSNQEEAFTALRKNGVEEALLYEKKPLTLASVEKLLGKNEFQKIVGEYVTVPPGKPTLAPEEDQREAISGRVTPQEAFAAPIEVKCEDCALNKKRITKGIELCPSCEKSLRAIEKGEDYENN